MIINSQQFLEHQHRTSTYNIDPRSNEHHQNINNSEHQHHKTIDSL
jgi:hypothetical protein